MKTIFGTFSIRVFTSFAAFAAAHLASAANRTWTGLGSDPNWKTAANWLGGIAPVAGDSLDFSGLIQTSPSDNFSSVTSFDGITFDSSAGEFTLVKPLPLSGVLLSGAAAGNNIGINNLSSFPQTVNLNLQLDWGNFTFGGTPSPLQLNGAISVSLNFDLGAVNSYPPFGGVAYFVGSTKISSIPDVNGLIPGLDGAGLISINNNLAQYPLATLSGGSVIPYASYTSLTGGGPIPSNPTYNIELGDATTAQYNANNISVNTITTDKNSGNSGGSQTITVTTAGELTLGSQGGIYVTGGATFGAGNKQLLKLTGGYLTAPPSGAAAGMIVLGVNGTTTGNQMQLDDIVTDFNGSQDFATVTLVKTGPGSVELTQPNTYSGGTYVDQGYLEDLNGSGLGEGPVYVANGAEVYLRAAGGNWFNDFNISPGAGPSYSALGAIKIGEGGNPMLISGTLNLLGSPVTSPPGDRIGMSGNLGTAFLLGQITGTGTLELMAQAGTANFLINNEEDGPANDWTGGLLIDNAANDSAYVQIGADDQLVGNNVTLAQSGTGVARLDLNGFNDTIDGLSAAPSLNNVVDNRGSAPSILALGAGGATATFGGVILNSANPLSVVKIGAGTQTLSGQNKYSGSTTISAGTLITTAASVGGGSYTVHNGATLDIQVAGLAAQLAMSGLLLSSGCTLQVDDGILGNPAVAPITISGALSGSGTVNIQLSGGALTPGTFPLIAYTSESFSGTFNLITSPSVSATLSDNHTGLIAVTILAAGGPVITAQPANQTTCPDREATFTVSAAGGTAPLSYHWEVSTDGGLTWGPDVTDSGANTTSLSVFPSPSENGYLYEVVVTDSDGNSTTSVPATLNVIPPPTVFAVTGGGSYCSGGSGVPVGLSGSQLGINYQLEYESDQSGSFFAQGSPVAGTGSAISFGNQTGDGEYVVEATSSCDSDETDNQVTVSIYPLPSVSVNSATVCASGLSATMTATVSSGVSPFTYSWTGPGGFTASTASINTSTVGTYNVTVADSDGCSSVSASGTLTVIPPPTVFAVTGGGSYCSGGSGVPVGLSGSQTGVNYQLEYQIDPAIAVVSLGSPVAGTGSAISFGNQTSQGIYAVSAISSCGSVDMNSTVSVLIYPQASVSVNSATVCASGLSAMLTATVSSGTEPFTYSWTGPGGFTASTASINPSTVGIYKVTVTDSAGCGSVSASGTLTVHVTPAPITSPSSICAGTTAIATGPEALGVFPTASAYSIPPISAPFIIDDPAGLAVADLNGDGSPDLIAVGGFQGAHPGELAVFTNNGSGGFVLATNLAVGTDPQAVVAADVNGDGFMDLICANSGFMTPGTNLTILTNNGRGVFTFASSPRVGNDPVSLAAADVNGDGYVDLISANYQDGKLTVLLNDGKGNFPTALSSTLNVGNLPYSVVAADLNGDGFVDLICANYGDGTLTVLLNDGKGGFGTVSIYPVGGGPSSVVAADVEGTGFLDLISANTSDNTLSILHNDGSGNFTPFATPSLGPYTTPVCAIAADVNGDGYPDLISVNQLSGTLSIGTLSILTNDGNGGFANIETITIGAGSHPQAVVAADLTGDGNVDLVSANTQDQSFSVFLNTPVPIYSSYAWTIDGGAFIGGTSDATATGPQVTYSPNPAATTVTLKLTAENATGCPATGTNNIIVLPLPNAAILADSDVCTNSEDAASGPIGLTSYAWTITGGMIIGPADQHWVMYIAGPSGNGTVVLTLTTGNAAGCFNSDSKTIQIDQPPVPGNLSLEVEQGQSVVFATLKLAAAATPPGGSYAVTGVDPISAEGGGVALSADGTTITYTPPSPAYTGSDSFNYSLSDGICTVEGSVSVTVTPNNQSSGNQSAPIVFTGTSPSCANVTFSGIPGVSYLIQYSPDLANWTTFPSTIAAPNPVTANQYGSITYLDCPSTGSLPPVRFYRTQPALP